MAKKHSWQVGDKVEVLDENLQGAIVKIYEDRALVHTTDGFDIYFRHEELVAASNSSALQIRTEALRNAIKEKESVKRKKVLKVKRKDRNAPTLVIDLHIEKLVKEVKGRSNFDILNIQLETAKRQLEFAIAKRIPKLVFIHGVGEGVLKEELNFLLKRYDQVRFYDANYQKYGMGATEVAIKQP